MLSYKNEPKIKEKILSQLQNHYDHDDFVKGKYWENGKGCAVGCTINSNNHQEYETRFGIPAFLAYVEDQIFENLSNEVAKKWPLRFMSAIPVGKDLSLVRHQFLHWLLIDPLHGVIRFVRKDSLQEKAILQVADLHQKAINGHLITVDAEDYAAARASAAACADAAYDAAYDACADAAYDACADAAACAVAACDDADAAARASAVACAGAAAYDAKYEHYEIMADKLIELLESL